MNETEYQPPKHLSERSKQLWASTVPLAARTPARLAAVQVALEALDRADAARAQIDADGMVRAGGRPNPLLKIEKENRATFLRTWKTLGLFWDRKNEKS